MAGFINFEAEIDAESGFSDDDEIIDDNASDKSFINDDNEINESRDFYRQFPNVENDLEQVLADVRNEALQDTEQLDEISNLNEENEYEMEVHDFQGSEDCLEKSQKTLFPKNENNIEGQSQLCHVILLALKYKINGSKNTCSSNQLEKIVGKDLFKEINRPEKFKFIIDQQYFFNMCYQITIILAKFGFFVRVYELKKNCRHLSLKKPDQQKIVKQLSSCLIEKYNGFTVIRIEYEKKERKNFEPLDIIYKLTKDLQTEPLCYFTTDISLAYSAYYLRASKMKRATKVQLCHYCNHFFAHNQKKFERHLKYCSGKPGVIYNFTNQSLVSYEDNFKVKGGLPFCVYFDFDTTAPTDNRLDPKQKKMFVASYVMIVAFHPAFQLDRVIIYRSFAHTFDQLSNIGHLTQEQIGFIDNYLVHMLKDCANEVSKGRCKNSLGQMFSVESALVIKTLLKLFNAKFKRTFTEIKPITKLRFESENKIDWQKDKYVICKFPMRLEPTNSQTSNSAMTYGDFVIRFEHTFLRYIFSEGQLCSAEQIKTLQNYYKFFQKYIQICVGLLALLNSNQTENFINDEVEDFVEEEFADETIRKIKNTIQKTEIKNALSQSRE